MKDKVEVIKDHAGFKGIKINGLIHIDLLDSVLAVHSYIDEIQSAKLGGDWFKMYYINFHLSSGLTVHCEYNDRELWENILKGLE